MFAERLPQTRAAIEYAQEIHAGQRRADGTPFVRHPLEVAALLERLGAPDHVIAAGVLHDVIEKTEITAAELSERFGPEITTLVLAVSDDERIQGYSARKAALRRQVAGAGTDALTLFAADKLSRLRELRRETIDFPGSNRDTRSDMRRRRLRHYQRSLALLEERLPASSLVRELRDELASVQATSRVGAAHTD